MTTCSRCPGRVAVFVGAVACAVLTSGVASSAGRAQQANSPAPRVAGYRELVADALSEYEAGHFEESRALMTRAHGLEPSARTLRGLGMVSFELREYALSVQQLEAALASPVRPLEGELRSKTLSLLERARSFAGRLALQLQPGTARVFVDGAELASTSSPDILLSVGEHVLEVRAGGYVPQRRTVHIAGGDKALLRISLTPLATPARDTSHVRTPWYQNPWVWVSAGVVVAAGTATAVLLSRDGPGHEAPYSGLSGEPPLVGPKP